jgi:hypothetical protein
MATQAPASTTNDLSLVSSQYGPGPVVGWLLAAISVFLSWTFDSRLSSNSIRTRSRLISADFIATVIFPLIATSDILLQLSRYPGNLANLTTANNTLLQRRVHILEAPLVLVEGALVVTVSLISTALYKQHFGKAVVLAAVNICGLGVEGILLPRTAMHDSERPYKSFSRSFLPNSVLLFVLTTVLVIVYELVLVSLFVLSFIRARSKLSTTQSLAEQGSGSGDVSADQDSTPLLSDFLTAI